MRIAVYKDTLANNRGADVAVRNLADGLAGRGHEVALFEKPDFAARVAERWDVFVSTGTNELLDLAARFPDGFPFPVVQQFHTDPAYSFRHWIRRWRRNRAIARALRRTSAIQVLRGGHVAFVRRLAPQVPAAAIGNWSAFAAEDLFSDGAGRDVILCPGALNKDKNQELLVRAFASVAADFPGWSVEIYGRGKPQFEARLRRLAERAAPGRISFMGFGDLRGPYADCAFVAFPSLTEGFGLAIADAAAFAKPCVVVEDWIGTCVAGGGICAAPDVAAYADALRRMMADADFRRRCGNVARAHCAERFSRAKILDEWERLLDSVVARGRVP